MSDIKAGDLVMVIKAQPCCGEAKDIGLVFRVSSVERFQNICLSCNHIDLFVLACPNQTGGFPIKRLLKIDPPALPESTEREKELCTR